MVVQDIQTLLDKFFADGFSMNCLCKATSVSVDLISKAHTKENLSMDECMALKPVLYFLTQLYACNTDAKTYLEDISTTICEYYGMSMGAVSAFLGLDAVQYKAFLDNPEQYTNGYALTMKLLHLFTTLVREKNMQQIIL